MSRTGTAIWKIAAVAIAGLVAHGPASGMEQHGGFALELDPRLPRSRENCATIGITNFANLPYRNVLLVARSVERAPAKPDYGALQVVAMPASRMGEARFCSSQVQGLLRLPSSARLIAVEVAVYRVTAQEPANGRWVPPPDENARLSEWLPIPQKVLGDQVLAERAR